MLRNMIQYPVAGFLIFIVLSFAHDGFRLGRSLDTYFLPMSVGVVVGGIFGWYRQIMEQKKRLYESRLAQEREAAVLGRAAAAIAHEVRNPLNALAMGLQRLQLEAWELHPEHRQLVALMLDSVGRANGIVGNLLRYTRPPRPQMEPMRLDRLIEDLLTLYGPQCRANGIVVRQHLALRAPVLADPGLLRQVVENLLRNAIEAQPEGGMIEVELRGAGEEVLLALRNGGFTLAPGDAERIFEPYFSTKAQGTGLGVSIARRIVEAHRGRMGVRSHGAGQVEVAVLLPATQTIAPVSGEGKGYRFQ